MSGESIPQNQEETGRNPDGTYKPGFSGNPGGRPLGSLSLVNIIKTELEKETGEIDKKSQAHRIVEKMIEKAMGGDEKVFKIIMNYIEGMPLQRVETIPPAPSQLNLSVYTDDELRQLTTLLKKGATTSGVSTPPPA